MNSLVERLSDQIPLRSEYYALVPVGLGSALAESLTGYISRLAAEHGVSPRVLLMHSWPGIRPDVFQGLDGLQGPTRDGIALLERLTGRTDMSLLTCQTFGPAISLQQLVTKEQRWCAQCFQSWHDHNETIYAPLLWRLQLVKICPRHATALKDHCPQCGQKFWPLMQWSRPGYCPRCKSWLGQTDPPGVHRSESSSIENELGQLIAECSGTTASLQSYLMSNIRDVLDRYSAATVRRIAGVTVTPKWLESRRLTLGVVVKLAEALDVPLTRFIFDDLCGHSLNIEPEPVRSPRTARTPQESLYPSLPSNSGKPDAATLARNVLADRIDQFINDFDFHRPLTFQDLADAVGCTPNYLHQYFVGLGEKLATRRAAALRKQMEDIVANSPNPLSLSAVAKLCGVGTGICHHAAPDLTRTIVTQFRQYQVARKETEVAHIRAAFTQLLADTRLSPLPIEVAAQRLGVPVDFLYDNLPDLTQLSVQRLRQYRHSRSLIHEVLMADAVQRAIATLVEEGRRPTTSVLQNGFGLPLKSLIVRHLLENYRMHPAELETLTLALVKLKLRTSNQ